MIIALLIVSVFIILRFAVTLFNFVSNPKLPKISKAYTDKVSILIPARNEAEDILPLLESIHKQDYPNYEVIILDDNSTDDTFAVCEAFAQQHHAFRVIKGQPLPTGWLGKNFACYQLAQLAKGKFFLFLDADEQVNNGLINSALHRMYLRKLSLLSLFTNQDMRTNGELLVVPLMHYILLNLLPLRLVYLIKSPSVAAASGQFMLFDAQTYIDYQWHLVAKGKVVEDVEIMKLVKQAKLNGEALLANGMISCRMYKSYTEAINGFGKNFLAAFNYNIFGFLIYLLLIIGGPVLIILTMNINFAFMMIGIILLGRLMISYLSGQNVAKNLLLHPIQMISLLLIGITSIQKRITKTTTWKGRKI
ncbi:glycosyltransferase family 2 protein [Mucilaginibacter pallidiroseus]|uniref:Glycosyltransferase family 2 protein n=1 Tax=Mucilaginibacter pallidiroseus TaxID=2599295 RepID=A0A563UFT9_9SPHI|nr:glycosyltransferase family 2 protein [Mucilaginibacter pallidiroseus]TWR30221.1 glycosyltransferase family 2 protein [Mucilaginibacter pallidiroseus]